MKTLIKLKIEKLEEQGQEYFVATSDELQGLVAEGKTLDKVIEVAKDVARILLEFEQENNNFELQAIPHHREIKEGTLRAVLRQAKIDVDDFLDV